MEILEYLRSIIEFLVDHIKLAIIFTIIGVSFAILPTEQLILNISSYTTWSLLLACANIIAVYVPIYYIASLFGIDLDLNNIITRGEAGWVI